VQAIEAYILNHLFLCWRVSELLLLVLVTIIPTCVQLELSYLLQSYKTHIFQNASIFSSKLGLHTSQGLNLTHESHLVLCKIRFLISPFNGFMLVQSCLPNAVGIILAGRIKGWMKTRFVPKMNALCVSWLANRILDIGYIASIMLASYLGEHVRARYFQFAILYLELHLAHH
jgi:hypothetical protein